MLGDDLRSQVSISVTPLGPRSASFRSRLRLWAVRSPDRVHPAVGQHLLGLLGYAGQVADTVTDQIRPAAASHAGDSVPVQRSAPATVAATGGSASRTSRAGQAPRHQPSVYTSTASRAARIGAGRSSPDSRAFLDAAGVGI